MNEEILAQMFDRSSKVKDDMNFTPEETDRFKKAFSDPEFRKLFADYMDEMQDPQHREETEAYISQLESEQKVPEGKELIRPSAGFVAKTHKILKNDEKEKVFFNIVHSEKIEKPSKVSSPKGDNWSIPYSLGPPHMEKDKKGDNSVCFDCCFHPEALFLGEQSQSFKNILITTAMDGVEEYFKRNNQQVKLERQFHIVKGLSYKQGQVLTMMIVTSSKQTWNNGKTPSVEEITETFSKISTKETPKETPKETKKLETSSPTKPVVDSSENKLPTKAKSATVIKRGFLNSPKSELYPEKVQTLRPKESKNESLNLSDQISSLPSEAPIDDSKAVAEKVAKIISGENDASIPSPSKPTNELKAVSSRPISRPKEEIPEPIVVPDTKQADPIPSGPQEPKVVVKHREDVSLGDFENVGGQTVISKRPSSLVYEIHLPVVTSPSKIVLDVSEKRLCLTYLDIYKLDMVLPYQVYDKKGKASYDKTRKTLTVTLPVVPSPKESSDSNITSKEPLSPIKGKSGEISEISSNENDNKTEESSPAKTIKKDSEPAKSHSRWVNKDSKEESIPSADSSDSKALYEEIQAKAKEALRLAKEKAALEAQKLPSPAPKTSTNKKAEPPKALENDSKAEFIPSNKFTGSKKGYYFTTGYKGLGYYLDKPFSSIQQEPKKVEPSSENIIPSASSSSVIVPKVTNINYLEFPFEIRQTKDAVVILAQISSILQDSVVVNVIHPLEIIVQFSSLAEDSSKSKSWYGLKFVLNSEICSTGIDRGSAKFNVSSKNMAILLPKVNKGSLWISNEENVEAKESSNSWFTSQSLPPSNSTPSQEQSSVQASKTNEIADLTASIDNLSVQDQIKQPSKELETFKAITNLMQFSTDFVSELD